MSTLEGQSILIVGGSSGIGYGVAKLSLLSKASLVTIASSNKSKVDNAISRLLSELEKDVPDVRGRIKGDVVDAKEGVEIQKLVERVGEVDHVVWTSGENFDTRKVSWPPQDGLEYFKGALASNMLLSARHQFSNS